MKETLRALREQNGYSQGAVAAFLGISRQMYSKYENEGVAPPVNVVVNLAKFYRVPYDVIIENKLLWYESNAHEGSEPNQSKKKNKRDVHYEIKEPKLLEVASPAADFVAPKTGSYYLDAVIDMIPRLLYAEQLRVLAKLTDLVHKETEEKLNPSKAQRMEAYKKLLELNKELHLSSEGRKLTREELYDRW